LVRCGIYDDFVLNPTIRHCLVKGFTRSHKNVFVISGKTVRSLLLYLPFYVPYVAFISIH